MKRVVLGSIITTTFMLLVPSTYACWCGVPDVLKGVDRAKFVFVGEVTQIVPPRTNDKNAPLPGRLYIITFKVEKTWKGLIFHEIQVLSAQGDYGCLGYPAVREGQRYLVYADPVYDNDVIQNSWSIITSCNRTARLPNGTQPPAGRFSQSEVNRMDGSADLDTLEKIEYCFGNEQSKRGSTTLQLNRPCPPFHVFDFTSSPARALPQ